MKVLHVISTRMFCKIRKYHDEEYFNKRLDLFEKYTLKSLTKQVNQSFHCLLFVNPKLNVSNLTRLKNMIKNIRNIHILYVDITKELHNQKQYSNAFEQFLLSINNKSYEYLLSSRIDSDDCWNLNYVELLHREVNYYLINKLFKKTLFTFRRGMLFYPEKVREKEGIAKVNYSFWSTSVDMLTRFGDRDDCIYKFPHSKAKKFAKNNNYRIVKLKSKYAMWLYIHHDINYALTDNYRWHDIFVWYEKLFVRAKTAQEEVLKNYGVK